MKIGGVDPKNLPTKVLLVLPRGEEDKLVFWAQGLPNRDEFESLVPEPQPPRKHTKNGWEPNLDDEGYKQARDVYEKRWLGYLVVKSLEPSNIEWDTVKMDVPGTWVNWESDLKNAGLTQVEVNLVLGLVFQANTLDESKLEKARENFLLGQQATPEN